MKTLDYPMCCGAKLLIDIGGEGADSGEEVIAAGKRSVKADLKRFMGNETLSNVICLMNQQQHEYYGEIFTSLGWKVVGEGPGSGDSKRNKIFTYLMVNDGPIGIYPKTTGDKKNQISYVDAMTQITNFRAKNGSFWSDSFCDY